MKPLRTQIINTSHHPLPAYETLQSAGMDLRAFIPSPVLIPSFERVLIPTGLFVALPPHTEAQIRPRSGLAYRQGITVLNSPGTIDADYRGEIKVLLVNLSKQEVEIKDGDRIAQMVVAPYHTLSWHQVDELDDTTRGEGGFGSTGV